MSCASVVPDQRAGDDVARVMDAGVDARVGDERGERVQRDRGLRRDVADAGREGEGAGRVPGGNDVDRRHPHVAGERHLVRRREPAGCGAPSGFTARLTIAAVTPTEASPSPAARRPRPPPVAASSAGDASESDGVVGRAREPRHRAVERGRRRPRDRRVESDVDALGVVEPGRPGLVVRCLCLRVHGR